MDPRHQNSGLLFDALLADPIDIDKIKQLLKRDLIWTKTRNLDTREQTLLQIIAYKATHNNELMLLMPGVIRKIEESFADEPPQDDALHCGSAILSATRAGQPDFVRMLLSSKLANVRDKSKLAAWFYVSEPNDHAVHTAIRHDHGSTEILTLLIDFGFPLEKKNKIDKGLTPAELASDLRKWKHLKEIAKKALLPPNLFHNCKAEILFDMMREGIQLQAPGYQDEKLQNKRREIFDALLKLEQREERLAALRLGKDKTKLLGDYLLNHKLGFWDSLANSELSAESFEKRIDEELARLVPKPAPRASTTQAYAEFDIEDTESDMDDAGVELAETHRDDDEDDFESVSFSDSDKEDKLTKTTEEHHIPRSKPHA